jgi:hypothetical protein
MLKHLSARVCLFVYARTHRQLEYYFKMNDASHAANQRCIPRAGHSSEIGNVIEFRPNPRARLSRHQ